MMEDEPVKHGHLHFLVKPGKILKKAWQKKYLALFQASGYAVQRAEMFDTQDQFLMNASAKIVPLNECIKVAQAPQKNQQNVFEVITKAQTYHFSAETTQDLAEWVQAFQKVAFGGPASSLSSSTNTSSMMSMRLSDTPTSSLLSLVLQPSCAEEKVNDIYSPIYGSEKYLVQVIETEAGIACGLAGHYQLVVNQLELLLCEAGSGSDDVPLYAWSYRHIRRYGRNKDVFTFEAGRKCSSGEGTFKFVTNEANTIFQSVQANTKNIKRDAGVQDIFGDHGHLGSASRMGSSRSIPPMKTTAFNDGDENSQSHLMTGEPRRSVSTEQLPTRRKSGPAPPPFAKPPRKPKTSLDNTRSAEPIRLEISKAAIARLAKASANVGIADDTAVVSPTPSGSSTSEPTYAEPIMRTDAWKTFALEADNIHEEKLIAEDDLGDTYYASVPFTPPTTSSNSGHVRSPGFSEPNKDTGVPKIGVVNATVRRLSVDDVDYYDHLSQFGEPSPPASSVIHSSSNKTTPTDTSGHHIYSRLLSSSSSTSSSGATNIDRGALNRSQSQDQQAMADPISDSLPRFIQNEDIYTVVLKPSKKGSAN